MLQYIKINGVFQLVKSEQQRQKKLAKKQSKARENKKLTTQRQQQMSSLVGQMTIAAAGHIEHCYIADACHNGMGIGSVVIVRSVGLQRAFALFLVDAYCLGVKDAMGRMCSTAQMNDILADLASRGPLESVSPGVARGFVEAAIDYAQSLGFSPCTDYRKVAPIWGNIEPEPVPEKYQFGRDGKPCYINGPYEDIYRQRQIIQTLTQHVGEGNFHVTLGGPNLQDLLEVAPEAFDRLDHDDESEDNTIEGTVSRRITAVD